MKNLGTGNYIEFRDISNGIHLRRRELNTTILDYANSSNNQTEINEKFLGTNTP